MIQFILIFFMIGQVLKIVTTAYIMDKKQGQIEKSTYGVRSIYIVVIGVMIVITGIAYVEAHERGLAFTAMMLAIQIALMIMNGVRVLFSPLERPPLTNRRAAYIMLFNTVNMVLLFVAFIQVLVSS